jgi:hypothetical protein
LYDRSAWSYNGAVRLRDISGFTDQIQKFDGMAFKEEQEICILLEVFGDYDKVATGVLFDWHDLLRDIPSSTSV